MRIETIQTDAIIPNIRLLVLEYVTSVINQYLKSIVRHLSDTIEGIRQTCLKLSRQDEEWSKCIWGIIKC